MSEAENDTSFYFYCNQDDGPYNNNPCIEQCKLCKKVESLNEKLY